MLALYTPSIPITIHFDLFTYIALYLDIVYIFFKKTEHSIYLNVKKSICIYRKVKTNSNLGQRWNLFCSFSGKYLGIFVQYNCYVIDFS